MYNTRRFGMFNYSLTLLDNKKYYSDDLLNVCTIYEAQNADNSRTLGIWVDENIYELYRTNDFIIVSRWQQWLQL